ncbi:hypothetical protein SELMODRAFT_420133 [Selaginella moellendorffii]|uniref:Uncharacterized protein n=1 Tax=Selaginella moellendorffii TaxID=88036 RepID=D8SB26_SELML|nr:hypothetical protein SELMODRAFT_420133 [Selaginella moellendorffii]
MTQLLRFLLWMIFLLAMAHTCNAPPPEQGLFRFLLNNNRLTVAQVRELVGQVIQYVRGLGPRHEVRVGDTFSWVTTLAGNVVVSVQLRVMNEIWREDQGGICSIPSTRVVYQFGDMVDNVINMCHSILEELYNQDRWYGYVDVVLNAFGIEYQVQRDELLNINGDVKLFRYCNTMG